MESKLLLFEPIYQVRVWGGDAFARKLGRTLPEGGPWGESWEVVDREEAQSRVVGGRYDGWTLRELRERAGREVFGDQADCSKPFPVLVKWLDCRERLSLQVHPPEAVAEQLGGEPKTENWLVVDTEGESAVLAGFNRAVSPQEFRAALEENRLEELVCRLPTRPGDSLFVPSGRVHAIDGGNLILEIQQNSDTTYRVYDWGRVGLDGKPRELHIEESLASIDFNDRNPKLTEPGLSPQVLADADEFRILRWNLQPGRGDLYLSAQPLARLGHLVKGEVKCPQAPGGRLVAGSNFLIPAGSNLNLEPTGETLFVLTDSIY